MSRPESTGKPKPKARIQLLVRDEGGEEFRIQQVESGLAYLQHRPQRIPLEEMCEFTKIGRAYLKAIEEEDYSRLPAPVFVRGFVSQIARKLRLPQDEVANAFISRYRKARPDRT